MVINVQFFAILKEATGVDSCDLEIEDQHTVADAMKKICKHFPQLDKYESVVSFAVNAEYAKPDVVLADGDELALLPPISGG
ncbi:MAG: molybdopterin converting factor subunit 1 [bacterium]